MELLILEGLSLSKRIQIPYEGQMVAADLLDFETEREPWAIYKLEDGTVLKFKSVVGNVSRLVDHYKPDGEPIYVIGIGGFPMLEVPPELRKQVVPQKGKE